MISTSILTDTPRAAVLAGTRCYLSIPGPYYQPGPVHLVTRDNRILSFSDNASGHEDGLHFSAVEAARRITDGRTDSALHPPSAVLATLHAMDGVRAALGIRYPGDAR